MQVSCRTVLGPVAGGAIGTSGMPLTASGRERPPHLVAQAGAEKLGR